MEATETEMRKMNRRSVIQKAGLAWLGAGAASRLNAQASPQKGAKTPAPSTTKAEDCNCLLASDGSPLDTGASELRPVIERYEVELRDLNRVFALPGSALRQSRLEKFYTDQLQLLERINFDAISQSGKVDYLLLRDRLLREQKQLATEAAQDAAIAAIVPFQQVVIGFEEARRRMETIDPEKSAEALATITADIADARKSGAPKASPAVLNRAAIRLSQLRTTLRTWFNFYDLYDPKFAWWVDGEYKKADEALDAHAQFLHTASGVPGPLDSGAGGRGGGRGGRGGGGAQEGEGRGPRASHCAARKQ
ncbi:MAG: hypothetical protein WDO73_00765 [Ignavibacteriota bacterium]